MALDFSQVAALTIPSPTPPAGIDSQVEYLESDGTQWIDTGIVPGGHKVETRFDVLFPEITNSLYLASESVVNESVDNCRSITVYQGNWRWKYNHYAYGGSAADTKRHLFVTNGPNGSTMDGVSVSGMPTNQLTTPSSNNISIGLFCSHQPWQAPPCFKVRIYAASIIVDGVLIRDFTPVRVGQTGYMYDKVSGRLFGNIGTGAFSFGGDTASLGNVQEIRNASNLVIWRRGVKNYATYGLLARYDGIYNAEKRVMEEKGDNQ